MPRHLELDLSKSARAPEDDKGRFENLPATFAFLRSEIERMSTEMLTLETQIKQRLQQFLADAALAVQEQLKQAVTAAEQSARKQMLTELAQTIHALRQVAADVADGRGTLGGLLKDPTLYPHWYQFQHAHPGLLNQDGVTYGLTEFYRDDIRLARLVANPGCYATSILLASLPLFRANLAEEERFIVDAKSGLTGAGRKADQSLLFTEMADNLRAYKVNDHQHMPEVLQEIEQVTGRKPLMVFVPQVIPATRGLLSTIYVKTQSTFEAIHNAYRTCYPITRAPFVRVRPRSLPELKDVVGTNYCDIGFMYDPALGYLIIASALDNLTKGAAGQAIQNLNVMYGFPETSGL